MIVCFSLFLNWKDWDRGGDKAEIGVGIQQGYGRDTEEIEAEIWLGYSKATSMEVPYFFSWWELPQEDTEGMVVCLTILKSNDTIIVPSCTILVPLFTSIHSIYVPMASWCIVIVYWIMCQPSNKMNQTSFSYNLNCTKILIILKLTFYFNWNLTAVHVLQKSLLSIVWIRVEIYQNMI